VAGIQNIAQPRRAFVTDELSAQVSAAESATRLGGGRSFRRRSGVQVRADRVLTLCSDLAQPGDELRRIAAVEFANLFVNRQAGLLNQIGRIGAPGPGIEQFSATWRSQPRCCSNGSPSTAIPCFASNSSEMDRLGPVKLKLRAECCRGRCWCILPGIRWVCQPSDVA
jgi:hypothetical protein